MKQAQHTFLLPLVAASLVVTAAPGWASKDLTVTETTNAAVVSRAFEAWASQTGSVFDILSPNVTWTIPGSGPVAGTYIGRQSFLEDASLPLVNRLATPVVPEVHHIWAADDRVIIRLTERPPQRLVRPTPINSCEYSAWKTASL